MRASMRSSRFSCFFIGGWFAFMNAEEVLMIRLKSNLSVLLGGSLLAVMSISARASALDTPPAPPASKPPAVVPLPEQVPVIEADKKKWGVEISVLWPFLLKYFQYKGTRTLWQRGSLKGDAVFGFFHFQDSPYMQDGQNEGTVDDIALLLGYRQYLWKGLHLEYVGFLSWYTMDARYDKDFKVLPTPVRYAGPAYWHEFFLGYNLGFDLGRVRPYVLPQVGVAGFLAKGDAVKWPSRDKYPLDLIFIGNVSVGIQF